MLVASHARGKHSWSFTMLNVQTGGVSMSTKGLGEVRLTYVVWNYLSYFSLVFLFPRWNGNTTYLKLSIGLFLCGLHERSDDWVEYCIPVPMIFSVFSIYL